MTESKRTSTLLPEADWLLLQRICREADLPPEIIEQMLIEEHKVFGMGRRHGIKERLDELVGEALVEKSGKAGGE
ncbi:MAG TPA: hypothetical protein VEB22_02530 [Phycisphaerales bacterium]|nr:hypothetical protein [Phycisphaerales bacterium]